MFVQNRLGLVESVETLLAQERRMSQISNNLANVSTTGFKKENVTFWEMLFRTQAKEPRVGKALRLITDFAPGSSQLTGKPLDLAIDGNGFFRVQTPDGIRYTRAGNFLLNAEGQVVTPDGFLLLGQGGPVTVEGTEVTIGQNGQVSVDGNVVNQVALAEFADFEALEKDKWNTFRLKDDYLELEAENSRIQQGYLEQSNVNVTKELTEMIDLHRAYQSQQKIVQTVDEMDGQAISRVGSVD